MKLRNACTSYKISKKITSLEIPQAEAGLQEPTFLSRNLGIWALD